MTAFAVLICVGYKNLTKDLHAHFSVFNVFSLEISVCDHSGHFKMFSPSEYNLLSFR